MSKDEKWEKIFEKENSKIKKEKIVIFVRFSHIQADRHPFQQHGGAAINGKVDVEKKARFLFNEERMEERFCLFENLCLPSLDAQEDKEFIVCLRCSDLLPDKWKERLYKAVEKRKYIYTYFISADVNPVKFERELLSAKLLKDEKGAVITARLDDDDAVSYDYVSRLKNYLKLAFFGYAVSFPKGYYVGKSHQENSFILIKEKKPFIAAGLAYVSGRYRLHDFVMSIKGNHLKIDEYVPSVIDSREPCYLVSTHEYNDSYRYNRDEFKKAECLSALKVNEMINVRFPGVDVTKVFKFK
ncbi:glycosyltransferase [Halomonas korlensis]|uniref:Putative rhamnosyl transferase n=1 Tax=Halomonas korlensis TaxID=463301 RepID=A0A1I7G4I1_9GAMM|nr:glycosyltransferase [Halomonas korlensis]SFU43375.1 Putative rhamnosyl transferase [Halomonas korlensis]